MRLHRFYIDEPIGSKRELIVDSSELANQIFRVFRLKKGDKAVLFDGSGSDYECEIAGAGKTTANAAIFRVSSVSQSRYMPPRKIYLCAALVKKDNFEVIVEKATELGVTDIIPILAERTEKKALNEKRLEKIIIEASEQSGRGAIPLIHKVGRLSDIIRRLIKEGVNLIAFHTEGSVFPAEELEGNVSVAVLIGPEGGWSADEIDLFHRNKIQVRCLGSQVLRAETAAVAALSQVVFRA